MVVVPETRRVNSFILLICCKSFSKPEKTKSFGEINNRSWKTNDKKIRRFVPLLSSAIIVVVLIEDRFVDTKDQIP